MKNISVFKLVFAVAIILVLQFTFHQTNVFALTGFHFYKATDAQQYYGISFENSIESGKNAITQNNSFLMFYDLDFGNGVESVDVRLANGGHGGYIEIRLDTNTGPLVGTVGLPHTGGYQNWTTVNAAVVNVSAKHNVYFVFKGDSGRLANLLYVKFNPKIESPRQGDVVGKLVTGYQGWFNAEGDGSPILGWNHWTKNGQVPTQGGNLAFELYPDIREYNNLYNTNLGVLGNGQPAKLFSSYDQDTVGVHFRWMREYNIDTVALQRFGGHDAFGAPHLKKNRDSVAAKVKSAAETNGRKFYIMYDISQMQGDWNNSIKHDWLQNVTNELKLNASSAYAKQDGKQVVALWGIGFTHTVGTVNETIDLINWFKEQGVYVIGGVPSTWRTEDQITKPGFLQAYNELNMISPWLTGRYQDSQIDYFKDTLISPDFEYAKARGIDYQPVIFPGFAWTNLMGNPERNQIPRLHGDFMWHQAVAIKSSGIKNLYVAMFDEYDEGTAIAKAAEDVSMAPHNQYFLTLDADGVSVSSDFYLRLTGDINRMLKDQIPVTNQHPTSHR